MKQRSMDYFSMKETADEERFEKISFIEAIDKQVSDSGFDNRNEKERFHKIYEWLGIDHEILNEDFRADALKIFRDMYRRLDSEDYEKEKYSVLEDFKNVAIDEKLFRQTVMQLSAFAAEIIGTAKDNLKESAEKTGNKVVRRLDLSWRYGELDSRIDKVKLDREGEILERIAVKFCGKSGSELLSRLASKSNDKYFDDNVIDAIEIPADYYDEIINEHLIETEINLLTRQLEYLNEQENTDAAEKVSSRIQRYQEIRQKIKRSSVTSDEALYAARYPDTYYKKTLDTLDAEQDEEQKLYSFKEFVKDIGITGITLFIEHIPELISGNVSFLEALKETALDTGDAAVYVFSQRLIKDQLSVISDLPDDNIMKKFFYDNLPEDLSLLTFCSYESILNYLNGYITVSELASNLGTDSLVIAGNVGKKWIIKTENSSETSSLDIMSENDVFEDAMGALISFVILGGVYNRLGETGFADEQEYIKANLENILNTGYERIKGRRPDLADRIKEFCTEYAEKKNIEIVSSSR